MAFAPAGLPKRWYYWAARLFLALPFAPFPTYLRTAAPAAAATPPFAALLVRTTGTARTNARAIIISIKRQVHG